MQLLRGSEAKAAGKRGSPSLRTERSEVRQSRVHLIQLKALRSAYPKQALFLHSLKRAFLKIQ